ncbi:MAG TPA: amidohydrolase family protein, partial [Jiangellaceae bacterium]|nr:amidohydrolase family protein [Jiangellaceae bacterium]
MFAAVVPAAGGQPAQDDGFDVLVRNGTVVDGSGGDGFPADVAVRGDRIVQVGDLEDATAEQVIDASGLVVAPGFIDIHTHASTAALREAQSSLTQGVTTELLNTDGGGSLNVAQRLSIEEGGLGINVGAYTPFNSIWSNIVGNDDRRATDAEMERMRGLVTSGMANGGWGVSSGLSYTPAAFAETDQVIGVVEAARQWRTNYPSHIRNENDTVIEATAEAIEVGEEAGLVPVVTHMKAMGPANWGKTEETLGLIEDANERGTYTAADVYPYLRSQTGIHATIPAWIKDGGREAMLDRFEDPELRPQILDEIEELLQSRVIGPEGVWIRSLGQTLEEVAQDMGDVRPGEAVIEVVTEHGNLSSIWTFGHEDDLERLIQAPTTAIASDGGASTSATTHPRRYGTNPRVLGRYVREQGVLGLEEAVHKMTGLPATIIGMVDRG